jgi:hypothetical protein
MRSSRRQRFITAVLVAGVVTLGAGLATLVVSPEQALACGGPPAGGTGAPNCGPPPPPTAEPRPCKTWKTQPRLVIHYAELSPGQSPMTYTLFMIAAVNDVVDAFNEVGGTSARVKSVEASTVPFTFNKPYNDTTPTIHLGFAHDVPAWSAAVGQDNWKKTLGGTTGLDPAADGYSLPSIDNCWYLERHIVFPDTSISGFPNTSTGAPQQPWSFGEPPATTSTSATRPFFDPGLSDTTATVTDDTRYANETDIARLWFRPRFLHELLHAFGMGHRHDYSYMDHAGADGFPWANRVPSDRVRPLPADVGWLRRTYPGPGTVYDVSVLNTWHVPGTEADADDQVALCLPSKGSSWSPDVRGVHVNGGFTYCGLDSSSAGPVAVCPGDTLRTRFTIANSSTEAVDLTVRLAFSRDEEWGGGDVLSPTIQQRYNQGAEDSTLMEVTWKVPSIDTSNSRTVWHPLVQISGDHVNTDWIPLRGALGTPALGCPA